MMQAKLGYNWTNGVAVKCMMERKMMIPLWKLTYQDKAWSKLWWFDFRIVTEKNKFASLKARLVQNSVDWATKWPSDQCKV